MTNRERCWVGSWVQTDRQTDDPLNQAETVQGCVTRKGARHHAWVKPPLLARPDGMLTVSSHHPRHPLPFMTVRCRGGGVEATLDCGPFKSRKTDDSFLTRSHKAKNAYVDVGGQQGQCRAIGPASHRLRLTSWPPRGCADWWKTRRLFVCLSAFLS